MSERASLTAESPTQTPKENSMTLRFRVLGFRILGFRVFRLLGFGVYASRLEAIDLGFFLEVPWS